MSSGGQTLGALLARLEARQAQITAQAQAARDQIAELTALLADLDQAAEHITITRKTLLELPDEPPPAPPPSSPLLPDHPAYQQIMAVFAEADGPLRAREVCEAMDLPTLPKHTEGIRDKLKRLADRGIPAETEPGLFTQPRS
jgi:hypothetical protein